MKFTEYIEDPAALDRQSRSRKRINWLLRIYSVFGIVTAFFAFGYFALTLLPYELDYHQQLALGFAGVGIALSVISYALIVLRREREKEALEAKEANQKVLEFLHTWSRFEEVSKEAVGREETNAGKRSLRSVISMLHEKEKLNESDLAILEEALQTRNEIVHRGRFLSPTAADKATKLLSDVIHKVALPV